MEPMWSVLSSQMANLVKLDDQSAIARIMLNRVEAFLKERFGPFLPAQKIIQLYRLLSQGGVWPAFL